MTTKWFDEGKSYDVLYLDFAKAFDKVCHGRLMVKLEEIGITGRLLNWIGDWLKGRKQRVVVDGEVSDWEEVISSVVQGSVLGGTLFNIYIDDIDDAGIGALMKKFADDTKAAKQMVTTEDGDEMQTIIDKLAEWADKWEMSFNASKCKILHVGRKIAEAECEKDLGVWLESSMKPAKQCATAARSANFALGQLLRAFHFRSKFNLVPLFRTFIRPKLEYAVAAWAPWTEADK